MITLYICNYVQTLSINLPAAGWYITFVKALLIYIYQIISDINRITEWENKVRRARTGCWTREPGWCRSVRRLRRKQRVFELVLMSTRQIREEWLHFMLQEWGRLVSVKFLEFSWENDLNTKNIRVHILHMNWFVVIWHGLREKQDLELLTSIFSVEISIFYLYQTDTDNLFSN